MKKFNIETLSRVIDSGISRTVFNALKRLEDCVGVYGCDLHQRLFNEDNFYIFTKEAENDLDELGVFSCIALVKNYEVSNFGDMYSEIEPCRIANMVVYIMGDVLLQKSEHLSENCWGNELTEEDLAIIESELQRYLESLDIELSYVAFDEYRV